MASRSVNIFSEVTLMLCFLNKVWSLQLYKGKTNIRECSSNAGRGEWRTSWSTARQRILERPNFKINNGKASYCLHRDQYQRAQRNSRWQILFASTAAGTTNYRCRNRLPCGCFIVTSKTLFLGPAIPPVALHVLALAIYFSGTPSLSVLRCSTRKICLAPKGKWKLTCNITFGAAQ